MTLTGGSSILPIEEGVEAPLPLIRACCSEVVEAFLPRSPREEGTGSVSGKGGVGGGGSVPNE